MPVSRSLGSLAIGYRPVPIVAIALGAILATTSGCMTLGGIAYLIAPNDVPAECNALSGQHVAVTCRPIIELAFSDAGSSRELSRLTAAAIRRNVRRCRVVDDQEVARWLDENEWVDCPTLGKAVDADIVVGIDLEEFRLHEGSTLLKGRARVRVRAYEAETGKVVFDKRLDEFVYPAEGAIPFSDMPETRFREAFIELLSGRIARCFHAYESRNHFGEENLPL